MKTNVNIKNRALLLDESVLNGHYRLTGENVGSNIFSEELENTFLIFTGESIETTKMNDEEISKILTEVLTKELIYQWGDNWKMQSINYHGLTIEYDSDYEKYMQLKTHLEKLCLSTNTTKNYCHSYYISKSEVLSVCIYEKQIFLGVIDMETNIIKQKLPSGYADIITAKMCEILSYRIENIYNQIISNAYRPGKLEKIWQSYLQEKYNDNTIIFPNNSQLPLKENVDSERE